MNFVKKNSRSIIICLFELLIGILLLINPTMFTTVIIILAGMTLTILGLINIFKYFQSDITVGISEQLFSKGILFLLSGCFCIFKHDWFVTTFPVLTILYGIVILIAGVNKIQMTVDMLRIKHHRWFLTGIGAIITLLCAVFILCDPFSSVDILWGFIAISLIIEAAFDIVVIILTNITKKVVKIDEPIDVVEITEIK